MCYNGNNKRGKYMKITNVSAASELSKDYLNYAISTANRSIASSIDGLKLVQRRVIQSAFEEQLWHDNPFKKVSRLDGRCSAYYHPHAGASGAIINLGDMSNYLNPLMQIHGNQGGISSESRQKISSDAPASARYLECKLSKFAQEVFDIPIKYLNTRKNYDGTTDEVVEFVPALPLALINSQNGIGTGYATNTASFPVKQVIKALQYVNDAQKATKALGFPDIPWNTNIVKSDAILDLHKTGKGSLELLGEWKTIKDYDTGKSRNRYREAIIVSKLATGDAEKFLLQVKKCVEDGKFECADIIDETSAYIRIIVVCKAKQKAEALLPELLRYTNLSSKESINSNFIKELLPTLMTPYELLQHWYQARTQVLLAKYSDELNQVSAKLELKQGIYDLVKHLKAIAALIIQCDTAEEASKKIIAKYKCPTEVASAILEMQLKKLVKLSAKDLSVEISQLSEEQSRLSELVNNPEALHSNIIEIAKSVAKCCTDRVSQVLSAAAETVTKVAKTVKAAVKKATKKQSLSAELKDEPFSARAFNKAKKLYLGSGKEYNYCNNIEELKQALRDKRHPLDDLDRATRIKKSVVKSKRKCKGKYQSPELKDSLVKRANNKGMLTSERLKEHLDFWLKRS